MVGLFVSADMERRLSAILAADVVGYSRLMGADEAGTLNALKTVRAGFVDGKITQHQGRIVKLTGDGMLVEFPRVVHAVGMQLFEVRRYRRGSRFTRAMPPEPRSRKSELVQV